VAPLLLYTDLAARTERIKFASLGLVLPAWDPLRVAEEIAVLDHLTKGRSTPALPAATRIVGSERFGQQYHATGAPMDGSAIDQHNREAMKRCSRSSAKLDRGCDHLQREVL